MPPAAVPPSYPHSLTGLSNYAATCFLARSPTAFFCSLIPYMLVDTGDPQSNLVFHAVFNDRGNDQGDGNSDDHDGDAQVVDAADDRDDDERG